MTPLDQDQKTAKLKVMLLNAENLFLLSDQKLKAEHLKLDQHAWSKLSTSVYENKPLAKLFALQNLVKEVDPDILLLCEVGGSESLQNFNSLFLEDRYSPALIEGNSDRNIDIGFLVRKNIGFYFDIITNKNKLLNFLYPHERQSAETGYGSKVAKSLPSHKFSRDAAELHLFAQDREKPFLIFLLTHLKSRLDPDGIDPQGFERRQAELNTLLEVYSDLEKKFHGEVPIVVAGDFNGNASRVKTDPEFAAIYQRTSLEDVCTLAKISPDKTATFYQVGRQSTEGKQLDYCFLSEKTQSYLVPDSVHIYRYKGPRGLVLDAPNSIEEKMSLPSDHYPVIFELTGVPVR